MTTNNIFKFVESIALIVQSSVRRKVEKSISESPSTNLGPDKIFESRVFLEFALREGQRRVSECQARRLKNEGQFRAIENNNLKI